MCFLGVIFVLAILGLIYAIIIQVRNGSELSKVALKALDVITVSFLILFRLLFLLLYPLVYL